MRRLRSIGMFLLGLLCAVTIPTTLGEVFLRLCPPLDLDIFLGESSRSSGTFTQHPELGVTYRSWESFCESNKQHLAPHLPLTGHPDARPVWAFFGNSFIQAHGMLGDTVTAAVPQKRAFYLKRNEVLPLRLAQIELLLKAGFRPERIFVELMPIDTLALVRNPLDTYFVTSRGALTYRPGKSDGALRGILDQSHLALTAWIRLHRRQTGPGDLTGRVAGTLRNDLDRIFGHLARTSRACGVPVTILLIPAYEQAVEGDGFAFNDSVRELFMAHGFDVIDPRGAFTDYENPEELYIPDRHLSAAGNDLLLSALLDSVSTSDSRISSLSSRSPVR